MSTATQRPGAATGPQLTKDQLLDMYRRMYSIRQFEEHANDLYLRALMPGLTHLYEGEEAVAVGICEALRPDDYITSTHRGHGHCLAKGAKPDRMFAELLGKEAGYCRGKGGSMHIADPATGNLGANAIVGGSAGIATGAAFAAKQLGNGRVCVCFFGEGALGQGVLYEVMNMAQLWKLPVIYTCENNMYNEYTHYSETTAGEVLARPAAFGIPGESVDGQDVRAVNAVATRMVARARAGRRAIVSAVQHLPLSRAPRGRHQSRILPGQAGRAALVDGARSHQASRGLADPAEAGGYAGAGANSVRGECRDEGGRGVCHRRAVSPNRSGGSGRLCLTQRHRPKCEN